jgi:hypothetical protein
MRRRQLNSQSRRAALVLLGLGAVCVAIMCILYGARPARAQAQPKAEYVDSSICAGCHADIAATYRQSGMGRSFHRVNANDRTENFTTHNTLYNKASDR